MDLNSQSNDVSDLTGSDAAGIDEPTDAMGDAPEFASPATAAPAQRNWFTLLGGLAIAVAVVVYFVYKPAPKGASASVKASNSASAAINEFLATGDERVRKMQAMVKDTEKVVQQFLTYPSVAQVPLSGLHTNPFKRSITVASPPPDESTARKRREEERQQVLQAVQGLQLQSIIHSESRRACLINNTLYREGQLVENFSIERIEPKAVIVRNGVYRFELKMQQ